MRLIAGANKDGADSLRAGIEIKLQPGWKTYWRYPGDSGVPPRFDFSGSDNVAARQGALSGAASVHRRGRHHARLQDSVIFPLHVIAAPNRTSRSRSHLKLEYAVCEKLCIPVEARAELTLPARGRRDRRSACGRRGARAEAGHRRRGRIEGARSATTSASRWCSSISPRPAGQKVELFVEGPSAEWALPIPKPAQGAPAGHRHFGFELDGLPPGVDPKAPFELTFTVVEGGQAIEVKTHLD